MWSEEKFEDKLIMMRDALVEFEIERQNIKMRATQPKPAEASAADDLRRSVSVNDEIFELQRLRICMSYGIASDKLQTDYLQKWVVICPGIAKS